MPKIQSSSLNEITSDSYRAAVDGLEYGKRLPGAWYLHRSLVEHVQGVLQAAIQAAEDLGKLGRADWDIAKLDRFEPKISLLEYPTFFEDPHPALIRSHRVDLLTGDVATRSYNPEGNPPILHRKETMLHPSHERWEEFATLTRAEEAAGLLNKVSRIGFQRDWDAFLVERGAAFEGHDLLVEGNVVTGSPSAPQPEFRTSDRAKTAIRRRELSAPVRFLVDSKIIRPDWSVFDYGCGVGADVQALSHLGFNVSGWDPFHNAEEPKQEADIVHLGYVLNVIEDPEEREEVLREAYGLARVGLSVAVRVDGNSSLNSEAALLQDGVVTARGTFQKYFTEDEFLDLLTSTLNGRATRCLPHLYLVLRDTEHREDLTQLAKEHALQFGSGQSEANRERRLARAKHLAALYAEHPSALEAFWEVAVRKGKGASIARSSEAVTLFQSGITPREAFDAFKWQHNGRSISIARKEHQLGLVDSYWRALCRFGRPPHEDELPELHLEMKSVGISQNRLLNWCLEIKDDKVWTRASDRRRDSVLVELAALALRRRVAFSDLSALLQRDVRYFFGSFSRALDRGLEILTLAANPDEVRQAAASVPFGVLQDSALFVCSTARRQLPLILRLRVKCACIVTPELLDHDVIKIDIERPEIVGYRYEAFLDSPLPQLTHRVIVNFGSTKERVINETSSSKVKLLWARFQMVPKTSRLRKPWEDQYLRIWPILEPFAKGTTGTEQEKQRQALVRVGPIHVAIDRGVAAKLGFISAV